MSQHNVTIEWRRRAAGFAYATYDRGHVLRFGEGVELPARAAPENIPPTAPRAPGADPEQTFVAAIASCHMLWFLHFACDGKLVVDSYRDDAVGVLEKDRDGRMAVTRVTLRPKVAFGGGTSPTPEQLRALHDRAHAHCFIASSVKSEVTVEIR